MYDSVWGGHKQVSNWYKDCKLLSDIGQCPTKFGKCPSKSNFDRTLVGSQKKIVTYIFLLWQNPIANSLNLHFAIKFTRHSSILLNVAPEWLYILVSWLIYILWRIYVRPNLVILVFVRPNSSYVRPKLKVIGQMSCQVKYLFAALWHDFKCIDIWVLILAYRYYCSPGEKILCTALSLLVAWTGHGSPGGVDPWNFKIASSLELLVQMMQFTGKSPRLRIQIRYTTSDNMTLVLF
jgi:hypothetical protein